MKGWSYIVELIYRGHNLERKGLARRGAGNEPLNVAPESRYLKRVGNSRPGCFLLEVQ